MGVPKVTLQDVAKKVGLHRSTVALALKDHPRISAPVRARIQAVAKELGYQINPLVAALMQARRTGRAAPSVAIGYVTNYPTRYGWAPPDHDRPNYFPGAAARAEELGYVLEHLWLGEPGMTAQRFAEILAVRGIHGVLIGRLPPGQSEILLKWEPLSCVALGRTLRRPALHHVTEDHHAGASLAMERLVAQGYRRVGFVFSEPDDSPRVADRWLGGYLRQQLRLGIENLVTPFYFESTRDRVRDFGKWMKRWKPDALLVTEPAPAIEWLKNLGLRVPDDVGLATVVNDHLENGWAGVHCDPGLVGALATEMLIGLMHRGERGLPSVPHEVLVCGEWRDGWTLSAKR